MPSARCSWSMDVMIKITFSITTPEAIADVVLDRVRQRPMTGPDSQALGNEECSKHAVVSSLVDSTLRIESVDGEILLSVTGGNAGR